MIAMTVVYAHLAATRRVLEAVEQGVPITAACQSPPFLEPFYSLFGVAAVTMDPTLLVDDPAEPLRRIETCLALSLADLTAVSRDTAVDEIMSRLSLEVVDHFMALAPHIPMALVWYQDVRPVVISQFDRVSSQELEDLSDLLNQIDRYLPASQVLQVIEEVAEELRNYTPVELQRHAKELGSPLVVLQEHLSRVMLRRQIDNLNLFDEHACELFVENGYLPPDPPEFTG